MRPSADSPALQNTEVPSPLRTHKHTHEHTNTHANIHTRTCVRVRIQNEMEMRSTKSYQDSYLDGERMNDGLIHEG
jgi:hypothetical protein